MAKRKRKHHRKAATAVVHRRRSSPRRRHHRRRRSSRRGGAGNPSLLQSLVAAAAVGYVIENVPSVTELASKIPGAKTFGNAAAIGAVALGVDHFVYRNKWVRLIGVGGAMIAAYQLGTKKFNVKWVGDDMGAPMLGDPDDGMIADLED